MKGKLEPGELYIKKYVVIPLQMPETQSKRGKILTGNEESKNSTASGMAASRGSNDAIRSALPPPLFSSSPLLLTSSSSSLFFLLSLFPPPPPPHPLPPSSWLNFPLY